jgi:hypothetical protein
VSILIFSTTAGLPDANRISTLAVRVLRGDHGQSHLLSQRSRNEATHGRGPAVGLPSERFHQRLQCGAAGAFIRVIPNPETLLTCSVLALWLVIPFVARPVATKLSHSISAGLPFARKLVGN